MSVEPQTTSVTLRWNAGIWAHLYDLSFGTTSHPPLIAGDVALGPSISSSNHRPVSNLSPGTTYYWQIVAKTMAHQSRSGPVYSFTIEGVPAPPSGDDIVLYAAKADVVQGNWSVRTEGSAAGGALLENPDAGLSKLVPALAQPSDYFEMTFSAEAGKPYHLWLRGRADRNYYGNDSVHVQFSAAVDAGGAPAFRIGTTASAQVCIEDGTGPGSRAGDGRTTAGARWPATSTSRRADHRPCASSVARTACPSIKSCCLRPRI
ncbi:MAG: hypothetical protein ACRD15_08100 [Vicinamibacterales bacterium]